MGTSVFRLRYVLTKIFKSPKNVTYYSHNSMRTFFISSFSVRKASVFNIPENLHFNGKLATNEVVSRKNFSTEVNLSTDEISQKVLHVCKTFDKIPEDKLSLDSHFMNDLGLDSLDHVELIMNIEDDFNFEIPDADAEKLLRPKDIVEYIVQKKSSAAK